MTPIKPVHLVVIPQASWGHVRPLLYLSLNLLDLHTFLNISFLLPPSAQPPFDKELRSALVSMQGEKQPTSMSESEGKSLTERIQIFPLKTPDFVLPATIDFGTLTEEAMEMPKALPTFITALWTGAGDIDGTLNKFASLVPSCVIFDLFQFYVPDIVTAILESIDKPLVPLIAFFPGTAASTFHHFAIAEHGGKFEITQVKVAEAVANGQDEDSAMQQHLLAGYGEVKQLPGLPKMYDYEIHPMLKAMPFPPSAAMKALLSGLCGAVRHPATTAMVLPFVQELEPEAHEAVNKELDKPILMAGIQFPDPIWKGEKPSSNLMDPEDVRVMAFLDRTLEKHGPKSTIFASFGSAFYPALRPDIVIWLLDSLHENKVPFIFAYASPMAQLPDELIEKYNADVNSCIVKFAPQWAVLDHPATGTFATHCGLNSVAEAIMNKIPLVCMPVGADQGEVAAMMVQLGVGIDLKQIKTFHIGTDEKFTKLYDGTEVIGTEMAVKREMTDVWKRVRGAEGEKMREKMRGIRDICERSYEQGRSREVMKGFSQYF